MYIRRLLTTGELDGIRVNLSVMAHKLSPEPVCDFCGNQNPIWFYAAIRLSTGEWQDNWRWLACHDCSESLEAGDTPAIEGRIVTWLMKRFTKAKPHTMRVVARAALMDFFLYAKHAITPEDC